MLVVMKKDAGPAEVEAVQKAIREMGLTPHVIPGSLRVAIGITGNQGALDPESFRGLPGVADAIPVSQPFKLVSREVKQEDTLLAVGKLSLGGLQVHVVAGPCAVESEEQIVSCARAVRRAGATLLRGGAFKPRTSPYDFQGLKGEGLRLLALARQETGLPIVTEVKDTETLDQVAAVADVLQVGARNMQNFSLLEAIGKIHKPVLLKRGMSSTIKELLMAAEYIASQGNGDIALCERGIRTFETMTRNTLDLNAVAMMKKLSHLPVFVDPSHGIGVRAGVAPMARAAVAAGADGLIVEVHPNPAQARSDGNQSLTPEGFAELMRGVRAVAAAVGRVVAPAEG